MDEQTIHYEVPKSNFSRGSILRLLWWIPQSIIINVWEVLLAFVLLFQFFHIIIMGERHEWAREFTLKFADHVYQWVRFTFWVTDEQPDLIVY